ncbi:hypothetical protein MFLO_15693 [Listeria floridensis FSL S10-1187]|uniref:TldD/PmbA family protein n=1 Tax=Listeria floridensis FSL S10-1187 TaxID=1265817 RepID=A0ABN0RBB2_9LIST|nr:hypothetical protein [Listeria floridensis]EUJ24244.1 hypothetical protein MFLO_15693 [Listeria floridensis FSL S10-1187]
MQFLGRMANQFLKEDLEKEFIYKVEWEARGIGLAYYSGTEEVRANDKEEAIRITKSRVKQSMDLDAKIRNVEVAE